MCRDKIGKGRVAWTVSKRFQLQFKLVPESCQFTIVSAKIDTSECVLPVVFDVDQTRLVDVFTSLHPLHGQNDPASSWAEIFQYRVETFIDYFFLTRPLAAVLSTNTKKTATPKSVKSLTARSGCVALTFAATSWTQIDAEMRCATFIKTDTNAPSPALSSTTVDLSPTPSTRSFVHLSHAAAVAVGTAESTTVLDSTRPMSSACCICASSAAASSSRAIEKDIDMVRSPPSAESASDTLTGPDVMAVNRQVFLEASWVHCLVRRHSKVLFVWRLFLSEPDEATEATPAYSQCPMSAQCSKFWWESGASVSRKRRRPARRRRNCAGVVCGTTLKCLLAFVDFDASHSRCKLALVYISEFLRPASKYAQRVVGSDKKTLLAGLAAHRVVSVQYRLLPECANTLSKRTYLDRNALNDVAVGATAALLCSFFVLLTEDGCGSDKAQDLAKELRGALHTMVDNLLRWPTLLSPFESHLDNAVLTETRCAQRAMVAFDVIDQCEAFKDIFPRTRLRIQLEHMRRASWPGRVCCDAANHYHAVHTIANEQVVGDVAALGSFDPHWVPLSKLGKDVDGAGTWELGRGFAPVDDSDAASWNTQLQSSAIQTCEASPQ